MKKLSKHSILLVLIAILFAAGLSAQTSQQKELEVKRAKIQKEIREINRLLSEKKEEKGNVLEQMDALDRKINMRQDLIRVTNQQSNLLNRQINANVRSIGKLRTDLELLKDDYAKLIQKSYQNKTQNNRLMFLFSSSTFFQAFKRLQYMEQYTKHRKEQGLNIEEKTEELAVLNKDLITQRKIKNQLLKENRSVKNELSKEIDSQQDLLKTIRENESKYIVAIDKKKEESRRIDREIEKLIRLAIASSNKKSGSSNTTSFALTPGFGVYADKIYPGIKHQNNGVTIATEKGGEARAIFEGEVINIFTNKMGVKGVYLRHGNYISMYYNLSKTYVKKGDKVEAKEVLGEVYTNRFSGATSLKFYLYQDTKRLNPENWIYQL